MSVRSFLRHRGIGGDRGAASLFAGIAALGVFVGIGISVDGGAKIRATQQADSYAEEAGRAAGQAILAAVSIQGGRPVLDRARAERVAQNYLHAAGIAGSAHITGPSTLTVDTTITRSTVFFGLVGIGEFTVHGHAEVRLVRGVTGEDP